jgi:hypothetical protein
VCAPGSRTQSLCPYPTGGFCRRNTAHRLPLPICHSVIHVNNNTVEVQASPEESLSSRVNGNRCGEMYGSIGISTVDWNWGCSKRRKLQGCERPSAPRQEPIHTRDQMTSNKRIPLHCRRKRSKMAVREVALFAWAGADQGTAWSNQGVSE